MSKNFINLDRLILLFFVFVFSILCIGINSFVIISSEIIKNIIFYLGFFGYLVVLSLLGFHYLSKMFGWLKKEKMRITLVVIIILGLGYCLFDSLKEKSLLVFLRDAFMTSLIIIGLPLVNKILSKIKKNKVFKE